MSAGRGAEVFFTILTSKGVGWMRGLIMDVRINGGGSHAMRLHIASRLTECSRPTLPPAAPARSPY